MNSIKTNKISFLSIHPNFRAEKERRSQTQKNGYRHIKRDAGIQRGIQTYKEGCRHTKMATDI